MEQFLTSLLKYGEPVLTPGKGQIEIWVSEQLENTSSQILGLLKDLYNEQSFSFPSPALDYDERAALCGLKMLFILTSATAFREIEITQVKAWLQQTAVPIISAEAHFSADLCLRYLADLRKTIAQIADGDPLLGLIARLGAKLPISSIGIPMENYPDLSILAEHSGLAQFHAERVIALADFSRASEPGTAALISKMVGAHHQVLIPNFPTYNS